LASIKAFLGTCVLLAVFATPALAEDKNWAGEAELGLVSTTGNTDTSSINGKLKLKGDWGRWNGEFKAGYHWAEDSGETSARRFTSSATARYLVSEKGFVFGAIDYEDDGFNGFDYRLSESIGYGHRFDLSEDAFLVLSAGPGFRQNKTDEGEKTEETIIYGNLDFEWKIADNVLFTEDFNLKSGEENTFMESITAVKTAVARNLALKLSYTVRNNSDVPDGRENTDTVTAATIVYGF